MTIYIFVGLKPEEKNRAKFKKSVRGYQPMHALTVKESVFGSFKKPDLNDAFLIRNPISAHSKWYTSSVGGEQIWPAELPDFKKQVSGCPGCSFAELYF